MERYRTITEGKTKLFVPAASITSPVPPTSPAFFNPRGRVVRDFAVLACRAYTEMFGQAAFGDPLAGVGAKSIRVLVEVPGAASAYINDLNPAAIRLARRSAKVNSVASRAKFTTESANRFLEDHAKPGERLSIIDLDPFGSPTEFVDSALRALQDGGMLSVTATDTAPLSGIYPRVAFRKYFGYSLRTDYSRELGLRLLCAMVIRRGLALDMFPKPVFVHADQHYMRVYFLLEMGAEPANQAVEQFGYIMNCGSCGANSVGKEPSDRCRECGGRTHYSGPTWTGPTLEEVFIRTMVGQARESYLSKHSKLLRIAETELKTLPFYYSVPRTADRFDVPAPSPLTVVEELKSLEFKATLTIMDPQGVRTDAPSSVVSAVIKGKRG